MAARECSRAAGVLEITARACPRASRMLEMAAPACPGEVECLKWQFEPAGVSLVLEACLGRAGPSKLAFELGVRNGRSKNAIFYSFCFRQQLVLSSTLLRCHFNVFSIPLLISLSNSLRLHSDGTFKLLLIALRPHSDLISISLRVHCRMHLDSVWTSISNSRRSHFDSTFDFTSKPL